ncbi:TPR-like protein [Mucor ambiguus]|uniref:TPR-like protein n=1 Tax=Mucor ambiguus TaxID=91626 RepID=A0A0C9MXL5_9FUNG|nr:TPR-like protein [Mucor ambiguus]
MGPKRQTRNKGKGKAALEMSAEDTDMEKFNASALMKGAGILDLANPSSINEIEQADDSKMELEEEGFEEDQDDDEEGDGYDDGDDDSLEEWMEEDGEDEIVDDDEITTLLDQSAEQRAKLKTGDLDEFQREMEEFDNNLALTSGIGLNRVKGATKKRITAGELRLSDEVKRVLGQANGLYIQKDYGSAVDLLQKIIKENPQAYPAWNTLGLVHEELGNTEKALQFRMTAALLTNDNDLWKELAQKSIECNATRQAIHCFSKVISNDPTDVDAIWDRAFLYKQLDDVTKAIDGFKTILEHYPHHFKVINELAQLYRTQGKTEEAIQMYEEAIIWHTNNIDEDEEDDEEEGEEEDGFKNKLGYSEINMLSELYLILNDYKKALNTIKTGLRLVQKRQNETWWVDRDDDDEYLEDDESRTEFPIELRVRMGVCRVYMNQVRLGTEHFKYLLQYPATTYPDLHQDIAYAYYDKRHFDLALQVFQRIIDVSDEIQTDLIIKAGDCFREVGDLATAVQFYKNVLEEQNDNVDVLMSLAAVYEEQGKEEEALQLVDYVMEQGRKARNLRKSDLDKDDEQDETTAKEKINEMKANRKKKAKPSSSIFDETNKQSKAEYYRQRRAEDRRLDEERTFATQSAFKKLDEQDEQMGPNLRTADRGLMRDYMRNAQEVYEDFTTVRAFYPVNKAYRYTGFYALRRGRRTYKYSKDIGLEAHNMANRLRKVKIKNENGSTALAEETSDDMDDEERQMHQEEEERNKQLVQATKFRGISFDKWLYVFLRYAFILAVTRRTEDAFEVLKKLSNANVFYQNVEKKTAIRLAMIGCGVIGKNETVIQLGARWLCNYYRFQNDPYRIYMSVLNEGITDTVAYASYNQLRYLMRSIRLMDALVTNSRKTLEGSKDNAAALEEIRELNEAILTMNVDPSTASEQHFSRFYDIPKEPDLNMIGNNTEKMGIAAPTHLNPVLLTMFGSIVNLTKSALAASLFFLRSYAIAPKDRLTTLSLGLSLLHSAITRKSENRHLQIMQGMLFIFEYAKIANYDQEAEYNIGRAFHLLGLTHLAVPHYEKALSMRKVTDGTIERRPVEDVYKWPVSEKEEEELEQDMDDEYDLKSEAAYNLHLIYITSGSMSLAQILMLKYCSV